MITPRGERDEPVAASPGLSALAGACLLPLFFGVAGGLFMVTDAAIRNVGRPDVYVFHPVLEFMDGVFWWGLISAFITAPAGAVGGWLVGWWAARRPDHQRGIRVGLAAFWGALCGSILGLLLDTIPSRLLDEGQFQLALMEFGLWGALLGGLVAAAGRRGTRCRILLASWILLFPLVGVALASAAEVGCGPIPAREPELSPVWRAVATGSAALISCSGWFLALGTIGVGLAWIRARPGHRRARPAEP